MNDLHDKPSTDSWSDLVGVRWLCSTPGHADGAAAGHCVEVAHLVDGGVAVRDPADLTTPPHVFTAFEWDCFLDGAKKGEFDRPGTPG